MAGSGNLNVGADARIDGPSVDARAGVRSLSPDDLDRTQILTARDFLFLQKMAAIATGKAEPALHPHPVVTPPG